VDQGWTAVFELVLWSSLGLLFYTYLGYPLMLAFWARRGSQPVSKGSVAPAVTIVIAARNEADRLPARIQNCLTQSYPADRLDVVVVSDGSEDGTERIVAGLASARVTLVVLPKRQGKAAALNAGVAAARGEIIVFADARQRFAPSAVSELVAHFHDPRVGAVSGELALEADPRRSGADGVGLYWRIEKWIRRQEGAVDSVVGATGAIYAIRRQLFQPLPPGAILDDVLLPMRIAMGGHRVTFEPRALAYDRVEADYRAEFNRKVRTLAGNYQALRLCPDLIDPRRNRLFLQYVSHKLTRLAAPFALIAALLANLAVMHGAYGYLLAAQLTGYAMAAAGWGFNRVGLRERWTAAAYTFCLLNIAALMGAVQFLRGSMTTALWDQAGARRPIPESSPSQPQAL
jgi:poly-beta-1,6-N-acetyl-D-glucosamine synthase